MEMGMVKSVHGWVGSRSTRSCSLCESDEMPLPSHPSHVPSITHLVVVKEQGAEEHVSALQCSRHPVLLSSNVPVAEDLQETRERQGSRVRGLCDARNLGNNKMREVP